MATLAVRARQLARQGTQLAPALLLLPFVAKPLEIDDDFFVHCARLFTEAPFDPFSQVHFYLGAPTRVFDQPQPLLWSYLLAGVLAVAGETPEAMHLATFAFAVLGLHGLVLLARRLGVSPLAATALVGGSSAFLVMGSSIMPDVPFVGCALAALGRLVRGVDEGRRRDLVASGVFAGAAFLIRYTGIVLLPLLLVYPLLARRLRARSFVPAAVAAAIGIGWELLALASFGAPHFLGTLGAWSRPLTTERALAAVFAQLVQLGGQRPALGLAVVTVALRPRGVWIVLAAAAVAASLGAIVPERHAPWLVVLFAWPATVVLADAAARLGRAALGRFSRDGDGRDPLRQLCALWLLGSAFLVTSYVHVAAKYMLLPLPAAVLLLLDGLAGLAGRAREAGRVLLAVSILATIVLGLLVALSDARWASTHRAFFDTAFQTYAHPQGTAYVSAEWGFRYYAERRGLRVYRGEALGPADRVFCLDTQISLCPRPGTVRLLARHPLAYPGPFAVLNPDLDAGFYSDYFGAFPYVPAAVVGETVLVLAGRG